MFGVGIALFALAQPRAQGLPPTRNVIYFQQSGSASTLDVYLPKSSNHKAVVWIESFDWYSYTHDSSDLAKSFTDRGFTFFAVFHGSQPNFTIGQIIPMVAEAVRFVRAKSSEYDINPDAIGVGGASSGGHLALEIGGLGDEGYEKASDPIRRFSDRANAVAAIFAPTDFLNWGSKGVSPLDKPDTEGWRAAIGVTTRSPREMFLEVAHDTSPLYPVGPAFPPTLLVHGDADDFIPLQQSQEMDAALAKAGVVHRLLILNHSGYDDATLYAGVKAAVDWFEEHLPGKKSPTL